MTGSYKEKKEQLAVFLNEKHLEWNNEIGKVQSQNRFAAYIGISYMAMSRYMSCGGLPNLDNLIVMASVLGPEVYDICGIPRLAYDDEEFRKIMEVWPKLNKEDRKATVVFIEKLYG